MKLLVKLCENPVEVLNVYARSFVVKAHWHMVEYATGALFYYPCLLTETSKCVVKKQSTLSLCIQPACATGSTSKTTKEIIVEWQDVYINPHHAHKHLGVLRNISYLICVFSCQMVKTNLKYKGFFPSLSSIFFL